MKTSCGKVLNLAHYFPYEVKLRLLAHSRRFLANQKARNAIFGAENLLKSIIANATSVSSSTVLDSSFHLTSCHGQYADVHITDIIDYVASVNQALLNEL